MGYPYNIFSFKVQGSCLFMLHRVQNGFINPAQQGTVINAKKRNN
jgi:hypothetical protein